MSHNIYIHLIASLQVCIALQCYLSVSCIVIIVLIEEQSSHRHRHVGIFEQCVSESVIATIVKCHSALRRAKRIQLKVEWLHGNSRTTLKRSLLSQSTHSVIGILEMMFHRLSEIYFLHVIGSNTEE